MRDQIEILDGEPGKWRTRMEGHAGNATDKVTSFKEALQAYCKPHGIPVQRTTVPERTHM